MGGVLVYILGQEVLHRCRIEHDCGGFVDVRTSMERVIDVVEDVSLCCFREMEVEVFDGWYTRLL